ncbi:hypothetical protein A2U01_0044343, partial [Trifolium medium]|nr:hypothetical protein [Trifolium medium]
MSKLDEAGGTVLERVRAAASFISGATSAVVGSALLLLAWELECPAVLPPSCFTGPPRSSLNHREADLPPLVLASA